MNTQPTYWLADCNIIYRKIPESNGYIHHKLLGCETWIEKPSYITEDYLNTMYPQCDEHGKIIYKYYIEYQNHGHTVIIYRQTTNGTIEQHTRTNHQPTTWQKPHQPITGQYLKTNCQPTGLDLLSITQSTKILPNQTTIYWKTPKAPTGQKPTWTYNGPTPNPTETITVKEINRLNPCYETMSTTTQEMDKTHTRCDKNGLNLTTTYTYSIATELAHELYNKTGENWQFIIDRTDTPQTQTITDLTNTIKELQEQLATITKDYQDMCDTAEAMYKAVPVAYQRGQQPEYAKKKPSETIAEYINEIQTELETTKRKYNELKPKLGHTYTQLDQEILNDLKGSRIPPTQKTNLINDITNTYTTYLNQTDQPNHTEALRTILTIHLTNNPPQPNQTKPNQTKSTGPTTTTTSTHNTTESEN